MRSLVHFCRLSSSVSAATCCLSASPPVLPSLARSPGAVFSPIRFRSVLSRHSSLRVFLDVHMQQQQSRATSHTLGSTLLTAPQRLQIELFSSDSPVASQNFHSLCTGAAEIDEGTDDIGEAGDDGRRPASPALCYRSTRFHRIAKGFCVQGGDLFSDEGKGQLSVYGGQQMNQSHIAFGTFDAPEERAQSTFTRWATQYGRNPRGLIGTAVAAPHLNGSQFFILTTSEFSAVEHLDGTCICFGRVREESWPVLEAMERTPVDGAGGKVRSGYALEVVDCGAL